MSQNYPNNYPDNYDEVKKMELVLMLFYRHYQLLLQEWQLEAEEGFMIHIVFEAFELESNSRCSYDYVEISHGTYSQRFCGSSLLYPADSSGITSSGNTMTVRFHTDFSVNYSGFRAVWS